MVLYFIESVHVNAHGYQAQGYMFLVKCYCRIKIVVDDYIVVDPCVIKSGLIIVWMIVDCDSQYWKSIVGG
jgi:hypothetical protein